MSGIGSLVVLGGAMTQGVLPINLLLSSLFCKNAHSDNSFRLQQQRFNKCGEVCSSGSSSSSDAVIITLLLLKGIYELEY